jgi:hypothetical protein
MMFEFEFLIASLLVYGLTNIIVRGSILDGLKEKVTDWNIKSKKGGSWGYLTGKFLSLTNCPMCTGFWVGMLVGALYGPYESWNVIFNGAVYSGVCWLFHCVTQFLGQGDEPERTVTVYVHPESSLSVHGNEPEALESLDTDETDTVRVLLNG